MSEEFEQELKDNAEGQNRLNELLAKDSGSARKPAGVWRWLAAALGAAMVLFYFYTAGITSALSSSCTRPARRKYDLYWPYSWER
jgi:hypothetical protein